MTSQRYLLLGLFFVVVFGVLGWFTLFKSNFSLFREHHPLQVYFSDGGSLRAGDSVLVAGMRWGKVDAMNFDPRAERERRVRVDLTLDRPLALFRDARIEIKDATVLGGKMLSIEPGHEDNGAFAAGEPLLGAVSPNVMDSLTDVIAENRESFTSILSDLEEVVAQLQGGEGALGRMIYDEQLAENLEQAVASISATFDNAQAITEQLRNGEQGTIGRLIYEDDVYVQLQTLESDLQALIAEGREVLRAAREGEGPLGLLLNDAEVAARVRDVTERLARIVTDLDEGRGTLGVLLRDPELGEQVKSLVSDLAEGRGTLGKLWKDETLYEDVRLTAHNLADASTALAEGRGTLGRLLHDEEIYVQIEKAVTVLVGSLEEAREAAPISTFLNTLFLGF